MSDVYELIKASSTVEGDVWTMLNNLGDGDGSTGQIIHNIDGTVISNVILQGVVILLDVYGIVEEVNIVGNVTVENIPVEISLENINGEIECPE